MSEPTVDPTAVAGDPAVATPSSEMAQRKYNYQPHLPDSSAIVYRQHSGSDLYYLHRLQSNESQQED